MNVLELKRTIQRKGLAPLYLIAGEEAYFRDEAVTLIRDVAFGPAVPEGTEQGTNQTQPNENLFAFDLVYGDETDASEILAYAREVSFFTPKRLIIVKWADKLPAREGEGLMPYIQSPVETTSLVFVGAKFDGRLKWVQAFKRHGVIVDCRSLYDNQRMGWIQQEANRLGLSLDAGAQTLLKDIAGEGLYRARTELEKLALYLPPGKRAGAEDVERVRGLEPGASVFDLAGAIGNGKSGQALHIVAMNLEIGEAPLRILGALIWQVRRIWKAKTLLLEGNREPQVAQALRIPPFNTREFFFYVKAWEENQCSQAWELFSESDAALKGGRAGSPRHVLDSLVLSLCRFSQANQRKGPAQGTYQATHNSKAQ